MWKPIASIIIIITSGIFLVSYIVPEYDRVMSLRANVNTLNEVLGSAKTVKTLLSETETALRGIPQESDERFSLMVPESVDDLRLANMLKSMAINRGIVLQDLMISKDQDFVSKNNVASDKSGLFANIKNTLSLERGAAPQGAFGKTSGVLNKNYATTKGFLKFTATYEGFLGLLTDLEKSITLMNITEVSLAPRKEGLKKTTVPLYDYQIHIETYSLK